ncbi:MAG: hypothetical protein ACUVXB_07940 [Bryobacteraceae bacterium]
MLRIRPILLFLTSWLTLAVGSTPAQDYKIYEPHPRLLLPPRKLGLLQKERDRQSMRWLQFESLVKSASELPEPGLAKALYARATGESAPCQEAVRWALESPPDLRQKALVLDWCHDLASDAQLQALASALERELELAGEDRSIPAVRSRLLVAVALAERQPKLSAGQLQFVLSQWWESAAVPALRASFASGNRNELLAACEILHAVRDNLKLDLRQSEPDLFRDLPLALLLAYYPTPYPGARGELFLPAFKDAAKPDLEQAIAARAAGLCLVSYDGGSDQSQFLQGFLMQDPYQMRDPRGTVYEFLWVNPYRPGLSYHHAPLHFHSRALGALFARSSWNPDATWLGYLDGELQVFDPDGRKIVTAQPPSKPIQLGGAAVYVVQGQPPGKIQLPAADAVFFIGLKPETDYTVEMESSKRFTETTDRAGILAVNLEGRPRGWIRIR